MPMKLDKNNFKSVNGRASRTGEYVALAVDKDGYPIVVYVNADNGNLRIARSISKSGTLAYVESVATAGRKYWTDDLTKACTKNVYDDRESKWTVEELNISNYGAATGNLSCEVDPDGYLHIVYAADGKLVYIKSANATSGGQGAVGIDNTLSCVLDNRGSNVDIRIGEKATIGGKADSYVPYISYVATPNSTNGLKLAFPYDVDGKNGIGAKEFEVMTAPSTSLIRDAKTCIELDAFANAESSTVNDKQEQYAAAIGVYTGRDYRALFYVGDESTYK